MRLVIIESPYAGDVVRNAAYARACLADSLRRGEAPIASHLLYTQPGVLDDTDPAERALGIEAGLAWGRVADLTAAYTDLGISPGMAQGIARAEAEGRTVERRTLPGWGPLMAVDPRDCWTLDMFGPPSAPSATADLPSPGADGWLPLRALDLAGTICTAADDLDALLDQHDPAEVGRLRADVAARILGTRTLDPLCPCGRHVVRWP